MLKSLLCSVALASAALPAVAAAAPSVVAPYATYDVAIRGSWVDQNGVTLIFQNGFAKDQNGWITGNVVDNTGATFTYQWNQTSPTSGQLYINTANGQQGPIYVDLSQPGRMAWSGIVSDKFTKIGT